jgi:hypothetical protein
MNQPEIEARFNGLIEVLQGTCQTLDEEDREWIDKNDLCGRFDDEIFCCETCGWWGEINEVSEEDGDVCQECYDDANSE